MARKPALRPVDAPPLADQGGDPEPPAGLGADAVAWWRLVVAEWRLAPDEVALLEQACQALDRIIAARAAAHEAAAWWAAGVVAAARAEERSIGWRSSGRSTRAAGLAACTRGSG